MYKCIAKVRLLQYTVVGTPCRRLGSSAEIEFRQTGRRLARGRVSEKQPSEVRAGPPLGAKASRSKIQKWSVTQSLKRQKFKIESRVNLCQIELEIFCKQHGTPRHLYRKALRSRLFCLNHPRVDPQVTRGSTCQKLYDQIFKTSRI